MIHIGLDSKTTEEVKKYLVEISKSPRQYQGFVGMFVDAWLKRHLARLLTQAVQINGTTISGSHFNVTERPLIKRKKK